MTARAPSDPDTALLLGEVRGQLRELIHTLNNQVMKNDATARAIAKLETLPDDIAEIKTELAKMNRRVAALEGKEHRRDGERGLLATALRSPLLAWVFAAAVIVLEWLKRNGQ